MHAVWFSMVRSCAFFMHILSRNENKLVNLLDTSSLSVSVLEGGKSRRLENRLILAKPH